MKLNNIKSILGVVFLTLMIVSCSKSDKVIDQITENEERGAILRQVNVISNSVALNSDTGVFEEGERFAVDLEYQDTEDGSLLSELQVYLSFKDNTDDETDNSKTEVLLETIPASDFSAGDRSLPIYSYSILGIEMLSGLGMESSDLGIGGDQFTVRFELVLTDGRTFSAENNSGTITGSYFRSPFSNGITVVCAPTMPTAGDWIIATVDSYGDGWNGGGLNIVLDGDTDNPTVIANDMVADVLPASISQTFTFTVPEGTSTISIKYDAGAFDEEVSFSVTSANGNLVVDVPGDPLAEVELLDYCKGGL